MFGAARSDNAQRLRELAAATPRPPAIAEPVRLASAESWRDVAEMLRKADAFDPAVDLFARVVGESPRDRQALDGLVQAAVPVGRIAFARDLLKQLAANPVNVEARLALSHLLASEGNFEESARIALGVVQSAPDNLAAVEQLASVFSDAGDADRLAPAVARLRAEAPEQAATRYYSATLAYLQERPELAVREAEAALVIRPDYAPRRTCLAPRSPASASAIAPARPSKRR